MGSSEAARSAPSSTASRVAPSYSSATGASSASAAHAPSSASVAMPAASCSSSWPEQTGMTEASERPDGWWERGTASISRFIVRRACCTFWAMLIFVLALSLCGYVLTVRDSEANGGNGLLAESTEYDFLVESSLIVKQQDMVQAARRLQRDGSEDEREALPERSRKADSSYSLMLMYRADEAADDLFTPAALAAMCEVENTLLEVGAYPTTCFNEPYARYRTAAWLTDEDEDDGDGDDDGVGPECSVPSASVVSLFYVDWHLRDGADVFANASAPAGAPSASDFLTNGTHMRTCVRLDDEYVRARAAEVYELVMVSARMRAEYGFYLAHDAVDDEPYRTWATRSLVYMGAPLKGFRRPNDDEDAQEEIMDSSIAALEASLFDYCNMSSSFLKSAYRDRCITPHFEVKFYAEALESKQFGDLVGEDLTMVIASMLFVTFYIAFHSGSLVMALLGIIQITLSLPLALFFYSIFRVQWFSQLHILAFFVVLGIGADDIFVFLDAWRQSKALHRDISGTLETRMIYTYRRTASAVFNTSFTTAVAFFATALSPIMPIAAFGIYAALCIICNYFMVISWWPSVVVVWEQWLRRPTWELGFAIAFCLIGSGAVLVGFISFMPNANQPVLISVGLVIIGLALLFFGVRGVRTQRRMIAELKAKQAEPSEHDTDLGPAAEIRRGRVESFFHNRVAPLMNWHVGRRSKLAYGWQTPTLKPLSLFTVLGLLGLGCWLSYEAFGMEPPVEQEVWFPDDHMFTGLQKETRETYMVGAEEGYVSGTVWFGLQGLDRSGFNRYIPAKNRGTVIFDPSFDLSKAEAQEALLRFCSELRLRPCDVEACTRPPYTLVVPEEVGCWLEPFAEAHNGSIPTGSNFLPAVEAWIGGDGAAWADEIGIIDGELKFTYVSFESTMLYDRPGKIVRPYYNLWISFLEEFTATAPEGLKAAFSYTGSTFVWMETEQELVDGIFTGFAICFPVAFVILCLATGSLSVSSYAILSIAFIVGCLLGFVKTALDWSLGVGESIAGTIVIGLAVDYTVHLGHAYTEAPSMTREEKTRDALTEMGVTVIAGGLTTLGSSVFMYACQVTFFTKMATLISGTIGFSLIFSLLFFMPLCALAGPSGRIVKLPERLRNLRKRCRCCRRSSKPGSRASPAAQPKREPPTVAAPPPPADATDAAAEV